ncbi:MAG: hypothetical protein WC619_01855 [Patescibacteria group bacterium]
MNNILIWLDGYKTYISALALLIIPFAITQGYITKELGELLAGIIAILMGGGKYITDQAIKNNTDLGLAVKDKRLR